MARGSVNKVILIGSLEKTLRPKVSQMVVHLHSFQ